MSMDVAEVRHEAGTGRDISGSAVQVLMGMVDETDIAEAVKTFGLVFSEKPVRMSILSATLALAFTAAQ